VPDRYRGTTGKGLTSLDKHQVHRWTSWYRRVTLAKLPAALEHVCDAGPVRLGPTVLA
jgi:hypothetical protein